jgi:hypothetical protein
MINLTDILEFLSGKKKNIPAVNGNTVPDDTAGYVIVVDTLPPAEEAQVGKDRAVCDFAFFDMRLVYRH